ncbi:MAG: hypothetical protein M3303_07280, partial [Gemmatimonadota bacterium]|nr:hypothetical protein [Gemmatimonadota bacterium]
QLLTGCAGTSATATGPAAAPGQVDRPGGETGNVPVEQARVVECAAPRPGWIWCDDFESDRIGRYFEYNSVGGAFIRAAGVGRGDSHAMRARLRRGIVEAGNLKLAFGRTPSRYVRPVDGGTAIYRDVYWRVWVRMQSGWRNGGDSKLSRATVLAGANWSQAAIGHVWSSGAGDEYLALDPASGTDQAGNLRTTKYNDFPNLRWLGYLTGRTAVFSQSRTGRWQCVEARMRLNDPGQANGLFELWIDDVLEARKTGLNWVGAYDDFGINAVFLENYWNDGSPADQERYFDNFVVSTQRIGCGVPAQ